MFNSTSTDSMHEQIDDIQTLLILPRIQVQNANCICGPLVWGFPSPTHFTGFTHALERKLKARLPQGFAGVGIINHEFFPQINQAPGKKTQTFNLTRNPLDKGGKTSALIEEGRAHMEITLVLGIKDYIKMHHAEIFAQEIMHLVLGMRIAGGTCLPQREGELFKARLHAIEEDEESQIKQFKKIRRYLMPGFALVHRPKILEDHIKNLQALRTIDKVEITALDAWLDLFRINWEPEKQDVETHSSWKIRTTPGWLVPISIGYAALNSIYPPGKVKNTRDPSIPFSFVENIYSVGEWISPHRVECFEQLLWACTADTEQGVYQTTNQYNQFN